MSDFFDALDPLTTKRGADLEAVTAERDTLREQAIAAHAALDEAGAPACDGVLSGRIAALAADLDQSNRSIGSAMWERDTLRAERDALRARLAERPCPPDPRDPPVSTAAEEAIERLWQVLFLGGGSINRANFKGGIEGIADAVEAAIDYNLAQVRKLVDARDHATNLATEQFHHRLYRT